MKRWSDGPGLVSELFDVGTFGVFRACGNRRRSYGAGRHDRHSVSRPFCVPNRGPRGRLDGKDRLTT